MRSFPVVTSKGHLCIEIRVVRVPCRRNTVLVVDITYLDLPLVNSYIKCILLVTQIVSHISEN